MTYIIQKGDPLTKNGVWQKAVADWIITARVSCPDCGVSATLEDTHTIDISGNVSPSVRCPETGCRFHETLKLVGWESV